MTLKWYRTSVEGKQEHFFSTVLTDATIVDIDCQMPHCQDPAKSDFTQLIRRSLWPTARWAGSTPLPVPLVLTTGVRLSRPKPPFLTLVFLVVNLVLCGRCATGLSARAFSGRPLAARSFMFCHPPVMTPVSCIASAGDNQSTQEV